MCYPAQRNRVGGNCCCRLEPFVEGADYAARREITDYGYGHAAVKAVEIMVDYLQCCAKAASRRLS